MLGPRPRKLHPPLRGMSTTTSVRSPRSRASTVASAIAARVASSSRSATSSTSVRGSGAGFDLDVARAEPTRTGPAGCLERRHGRLRRLLRRWSVYGSTGRTTRMPIGFSRCRVAPRGHGVGKLDVPEEGGIDGHGAPFLAQLWAKPWRRLPARARVAARGSSARERARTIQVLVEMPSRSAAASTAAFKRLRQAQGDACALVVAGGLRLGRRPARRRRRAPARVRPAAPRHGRWRAAR